MNYMNSRPNTWFQATLTREFFTSEAPAPQPSPLKEQNRVVMLREGKITDAHRSEGGPPLRNQNCSRNKDEQFCFPRFARAGARAGAGAGFGQGSKRERWNVIIEFLLKW
jgi:hypothetical protein